ncbi:MAG: hypothetical protein CMO16_02875 [Thaumarchaeota archaeon]|nr:hypothetical protein [Nitrososphaerota archaeon]
MAHVTVADTVPRVDFTVGGSSTTNFAFTFTFYDNADIAVYVGGTKQTLTTHYTITGTAGTDNGFVGGTVVLGTGVTNTTVSVLLDIAAARSTDFPSSGPFNVTTLNTELDKFTSINRQLEHKLTRAVSMTEAEIDGPAMTLPAKADRLGKYLAFNAVTGAVEAGASSDDVATLTAVTDDIATLADIEDGTVATNAIQNIAAHAANVGIVGGAISSVNTVAGIASQVTTVAADGTDIGVVAGKATEIGLLGTVDAVSDMNTLAAIAANITSVAGDATDIGAVAAVATEIGALGTTGNITNMGTLAASGVITTMGTVAGGIANVNLVGGSIASVNTVASGIANVNTVASDLNEAISEIETVAFDLQEAAPEIDAVAGSIANVDAVGAAITNVNLVGGAIANINTTAANITGVNYFGERYRVNNVEPLSSNDAGDLYFNTTTSTLRVFNGTTWTDTVTSSAVSSVGISGADGVTVLSGSPVTSSGTIALSGTGLTPRTSATGSSTVPSGTTAQRDGSPTAGAFRYNTTLGQFEGYTNAWGEIGGGGGGYFKGDNGTIGSSAGDIFRINETELNTSTTILSTENASCTGPVAVASGITLTVNGNLSVI